MILDWRLVSTFPKDVAKEDGFSSSLYHYKTSEHLSFPTPCSSFDFLCCDLSTVWPFTTALHGRHSSSSKSSRMVTFFWELWRAIRREPNLTLPNIALFLLYLVLFLEGLQFFFVFRTITSHVHWTWLRTKNYQLGYPKIKEQTIFEGSALI